MEEKYLNLLDKQIEKLKSDEFDLDAWKSSSVYVLSLVFGKDDPKIKEIENLKVEYSSWSLRDASPDYRPIETCKKKGREIMEISKDEVEFRSAREQLNSLENKLKKILSSEQFEELNNADDDERTKILKTLKKDELISLIKSLL